MQTHAETLAADNGATVELATITAPNGTEHTALGSIIDQAAGIAIAYVTGDGRRGDLTNWQGEPIGSYEITNEWCHRTRYNFAPTRMRSYAATLTGIPGRWYGKHGHEWNQSIILRRAK